MLPYIISSIASVLSGAILYFMQRHFKKADKRACEAEERSTNKDILVLKTLKALGELTMANAIALKNGHTNGELKKAQNTFEDVDKELNDFLISNAVKKVNNGR